MKELLLIVLSWLDLESRSVSRGYNSSDLKSRKEIIEPHGDKGFINQPSFYDIRFS